jgi:Fe-S-cluster containining protein
MSDWRDQDGEGGPLAPEHEMGAAAEQAMRNRARPVELEIFDGIRTDRGEPMLPVRLGPEDVFAFRCHRGVACWNACCHDTDIILTPLDILRLSRRLKIRPREFLLQYAHPAIHEPSSLPVAKLNMRLEGTRAPCVFVHAADGCTVYADRPDACRYYPLGFATVKLRDGEGTTDFHFLVKEVHCLGHAEDKLQSVAAFRREQGLDDNDRINRAWMDILMKMVSWRTLGGPGCRDIAPETRKMFFMLSTDVDSFRQFVFTTRFLASYQVEPATVERAKTDDELLLALGFDWMKSVMFNEPTLALREDVLRRAIARQREDVGGA